MTDYARIDLCRLIGELGDHYDPTRRDDYVSPCPECGEDLTQEMNECPVCNIPVVWINSQTWKLSYGLASSALQRLSVQEPDEDDEPGRELLRELGRAGFRTKTDKARWDKARRYLSTARLREMMHYVLSKTGNRGAMAHLLNWTDKEVAGRKVTKKQDTQLKRKPQPDPGV